MRTDRNHGNDTLYQFLSTTGKVGGTTNASGNYSSAVTLFSIAPDPKEVFYITQLKIWMIVNANPVAWLGYGHGGALANSKAIEVYIREGTTILNRLYPAGTITSNIFWQVYTDEFKLVTATSPTQTLLTFTDNLFNSQPIILRGDRGHSLAFALNDNFNTRVSSQTFLARGLKETAYTYSY